MESIAQFIALGAIVYAIVHVLKLAGRFVSAVERIAAACERKTE